MAEITTFQTVLEALQEPKKEFPQVYLQHFSDLDPQALKSLMAAWPRLKLNRKLSLLDGLLSMLDSDTLVSFEDLGRALLNDPEADVRTRAIRLLAESDDPKLVRNLIDILQNDPDLGPRLEAADLLGEFVLLGELEELPQNLHHESEDALLKVFNSEEHAILRRHSLEALGFSSRQEMETLIRSAFSRADPAWISSALTAMGRSSDLHWSEPVVSMLLNEDARIRQAAVRAAGELSLEPARSVLLHMLEEEDDDDVTSAAIWSLSQIGGEDVREYLEALVDQTDDEDLIEYIDEALGNLDFTEDLEHFDLMSLDEDELDALNEDEGER